jgi:hypothetical protein
VIALRQNKSPTRRRSTRPIDSGRCGRVDSFGIDDPYNKKLYDTSITRTVSESAPGKDRATRREPSSWQLLPAVSALWLGIKTMVGSEKH